MGCSAVDGLSAWAARRGGTGVAPAGGDTPTPPQGAPPAGREALSNPGRGAACAWKSLSARAGPRAVSLGSQGHPDVTALHLCGTVSAVSPSAEAGE